MLPRSSLTLPIVLLLLFLGASATARGEAAGSVRVLSPQLRAIAEDGLTMSKTLQELVQRLDASDVVIYLTCAQTEVPQARSFDGKLRFLSAAGNVRYVVAHVNCRLSREEQTALLGHELRHAVEIADDESVVDIRTFGRCFARIGFLVARDGPRVTYDTDAARGAQRAVQHDLRSARSAVSGTREK
ncbi:MAG TPA: hypothetical protein VHU82_09970 [Vicinamibacterales bacterium]|jgi:hypothetical protein|nr:hypothetical protein [Vicinamibacterales bacterium]